MSNLNAVQEAIASKLKASPALSMLRTCEAHDGTFDEAEIDRVFKVMPAALVVVLGSDDHKTVGHLGASDAAFAVFVLVAGVQPKMRAKQAAAISEIILELARKERWGLEAVMGLPSRLRAENLYARGIDDKGVAMWAVRWSQQVSLTKEIDLASLADFNAVAGTIEHGGDKAPDAETATQLNEEE